MYLEGHHKSPSELAVERYRVINSSSPEEDINRFQAEHGNWNYFVASDRLHIGFQSLLPVFIRFLYDTQNMPADM